MYGDRNIQAYGNGILISWKLPASKELFGWLTGVKKQLAIVFKKEVVLTYQELLIKNLQPTAANLKELNSCLKDLDTAIAETKVTRVLRIPVCYDLSFGVDLESMAKAKNSSIKKIVELHTTPEYLVYFMGFLPGFPYLLGLDKILQTPRKEVPTSKVTAGSVAIGGSQTGIYPQDSPGGWHIIGHCPIPIFDVQSEEKSLFQSGDILKFESVTVKEHKELSNRSITEFVNSSFVQT